MNLEIDVSRLKIDELEKQLFWLAFPVRVKFNMKRVIAIVEENDIVPDSPNQ